ncbi:MAG: single-stranded DNA-binding protein [Pseudomonadota bacterium]|jgi:hypothetical protein|nr:single-stranded DNA-binding protein [Pseudomonadota bacterium]
MSFNELKRSRSGFDKLQSALEKDTEASNKNFSDDRYWKPELDKSGNGYAVLRFLPAANGEELPWIQYWDHGFQGPGGWFIEKSLTTLGKADPVSEHNTTLWNSGEEANKDIARKQKRRLHYVSNILVVSDPKHPEFEGKVMLYRYGKKIFEKVKDVMQPQFEDENPLNPFDLWEGADFKLKVRKVDGYWNYDKSEFSAPAPLSEDDSELESIYNKQHSLAELIAPDQFKSYDELKIKMERVLGLNFDGVSTATAETIAEDNSVGNVATADDVPWSNTPAQVATSNKEDNSLSYFEKLANDA